VKRICFINGSLRGEAASSLRFLQGLDKLLCDKEFEKPIITVKAMMPGAYPEEMLKMMGSAHALVVAFPLFSYSLPGALMRLLEDYNAYAKQNVSRSVTRVYAIVNCAFAAPEINAEAIRVMRNFCRSAGLEWRFALSIGCGPLAALTSGIPLLNMRIWKGFREISEDIRRDGREARETFMVKPLISKAILIAIRDRMERKAQLRFERKTKLSYEK
jgi:hypothetical protein